MRLAQQLASGSRPPAARSRRPAGGCGTSRRTLGIVCAMSAALRPSCERFAVYSGPDHPRGRCSNGSDSDVDGRRGGCGRVERSGTRVRFTSLTPSRPLPLSRPYSYMILASPLPSRLLPNPRSLRLRRWPAGDPTAREDSHRRVLRRIANSSPYWRCPTSGRCLPSPPTARAPRSVSCARRPAACSGLARSHSPESCSRRRDRRLARGSL